MEENLPRLPDLPKSGDKFWNGGIKYISDLTNKKPRCEHYFEYKSAREVVCKNCNIGYYFSGKEYIENGQIATRT